MSWQFPMKMTGVEQIAMLHTDSLYCGSMVDWGLEIAVSYQVAVCGESGISSQILLDNTVDLYMVDWHK
jgi:hypothetical protein